MQLSGSVLPQDDSFVRHFCSDLCADCVVLLSLKVKLNNNHNGLLASYDMKLLRVPEAGGYCDDFFTFFFFFDVLFCWGKNTIIPK